MSFQQRSVTTTTLLLLLTTLPIALSAPFKSYSPRTTNTSSFSWDETTALLAFGDSYTYVQGTLGYPNSTFIGSWLNFSYTPEQLFADEIVANQTGTSAGGPNWVEYLTGCFDGKPADCGHGKTYLQGDGKGENGTWSVETEKMLWDFAFGGADITRDLLTPHHNWSVDLVDQINQWNTYARPYLPINTSTTLVAIWIGINDIDDSATKTNVSFPAFYAEDIGIMFDSVDLIRQAGFSNYLFMKLPPLDKIPGNVLRTAANETTIPSPTQIEEWEDALEAAVANFSQASGVENVFVFDSYDFLDAVIVNAESYGIKNTTGYCPEYDWPEIATDYALYGCLPIYEYFWYNTGHITYHVHEILAKGVADFLHAQS